MRTLKDYRPQHDEDCAIYDQCGHIEGRCDSTIHNNCFDRKKDHEFVPSTKSCSCGLDALIATDRDICHAVWAHSWCGDDHSMATRAYRALKDQAEKITALEADIARQRLLLEVIPEDGSVLEALAKAEAALAAFQQALSSAGVTEQSGELTWVFKPDKVYVAASGGTAASRLEGVLRQTHAVIERLDRDRSELMAALRRISEQSFDDPTAMRFTARKAIANK